MSVRTTLCGLPLSCGRRHRLCAAKANCEIRGHTPSACMAHIPTKQNKTSKQGRVLYSLTFAVGSFATRMSSKPILGGVLRRVRRRRALGMCLGGGYCAKKGSGHSTHRVATHSGTTISRSYRRGGLHRLPTRRAHAKHARPLTYRKPLSTLEKRNRTEGTSVLAPRTQHISSTSTDIQPK